MGVAADPAVVPRLARPGHDRGLVVVHVLEQAQRVERLGCDAPDAGVVARRRLRGPRRLRRNRAQRGLSGWLDLEARLSAATETSHVFTSFDPI